jgi:excinuclease ABC subunit B
MAAPLKLQSPFQPSGDQPSAIAGLTASLQAGARHQTLLGVTGSGKTFTMASIAAQLNRPMLVIAPNKTLAAQLYNEFKEFFPENNVSYFVSYYDYYQPEAYVPSTDTYIEKDSAINDEIDKMRHSATRSILESRDTIVIASVSCIYGLGAPEDYFNMMVFLERGDIVVRDELLLQLVHMQYKRSDVEFSRGNFRVRGETVDIFPADQDSKAIRVLFFGDEIEELSEIDSITGKTLRKLERFAVYPVSHFITNKDRLAKAIQLIDAELKDWLPRMRNDGKVAEAERLERRTRYDMEMLREVGFCSGVENYSRHLAGRDEGQPPTTLIDYFPEDVIVVLDESHVTLPQIRGMYRGDRARKQNLVDFGFRLPSALDNRPLMVEEFWERTGQLVFVSATPGEYELEVSGANVVEQINRPTGLVDPGITIKPALNQVDDLVSEIQATIANNERVLVTTLTKRMSEDLSNYLREIGIQCRYLHSDIKTIERVEILRGLRRGDFDVLIGINLLREGLDLVEVSLVAILDADKEGFLRSTRSLIQTMGRAARNINGRVILYADTVTQSMAQAISESERRRGIQLEYNELHGITPRTASRKIDEALSNEKADESNASIVVGDQVLTVPSDPKEMSRLVERLRKDMFDAASRREFERAAELRDAINRLQTQEVLQGD